MSYYKTKQALITQLLGASIPNITSTDIAFENRDFDPANKSLWLSCYFIPATTDMMGKTSASTVNNGTENESWFKRDISINYLTFSTR